MTISDLNIFSEKICDFITET